MSKLVGAIALVNPASSFAKQALLLFDVLIARGDMLPAEDFFANLPTPVNDNFDLTDMFAELYSSDAIHLFGFDGVESGQIAATWFHQVVGDASPPDEVADMDRQTLQLVDDIYAKVGGRAVPLIHHLHSLPSDEPGRRTVVLRAAMRALPLPTAETPWQAIFDWRRDQDAVRQYRRLRAWLNNACRSGLSEHDVEDELATLVDDYQQYMSIHHSKMTRSRMEFVITTAADLIEGIVRLRLSNTVAKLFELLRGEISVQSADLAAPGRAAAYIAAARERFP